MLRLFLAAILGLLVAGCGAVGIATQPDRPDGGPVCEDVKVQGGLRVLSCAEAVATAEAALGFHWPVTAATFNRGPGGRDPNHVVCENEGCMALQVGTGLVRFEFTLGEPIEVRVTLNPNGVPIAEAPQVAVQR